MPLVSVYNALLDLFFPPLCRICRASTRRLVCETCSDLLTLIDPLTRCRHCFEPAEENRLCRACGHASELIAPRAFLFEETHTAAQFRALLRQDRAAPLVQTLVSFLIIQWSRLGWRTPHRIALIPSQRRHPAMEEIAREFSRQMEIPFVEELKLEWVAPFEWEIRRKSHDFIEYKRILLIDEGHSDEWVQQALDELWPGFPSEIRILSAFPKSPPSAKMKT